MGKEITVDQRIKNREKLANFLEKQVLDRQFDMEHFRRDSWGDCVDFLSETNCGTIGCALGWGPFVVKPRTNHYTPASALFGKRLDFSKYEELFIRRIGIVKNDRDLFKHKSVFEFLFGAFWGHTRHSTKYDAAHRLRLLNQAVKGNSPDLLVDDNQFEYFFPECRPKKLKIAKYMISNELR